MRLLFIRHGDPDYINDSLTPKGRREASLLAKTAPGLNLGTCYVSPLGRAQETASCCLKATGKTARTLPWLREFPSTLDLNKTPLLRDAYTEYRAAADGSARCSFWDMLPDFWAEEPSYMDPVHWRECPIAKACSMPQLYDEVTTELDRLLAAHGYVHEGHHFRVEKESGETLTFFCHFAISCALISHIWGISPFTLWFHTQLAPTSVTELVTEERTPGFAHFRSQRMGDISHLTLGGEEPSFAGRFCETYSNREQRH